MKAGPEGKAAGAIARTLALQGNTLSAQLLLLANAGLIRARREGRSIIYAVNFEAMRDLLVFLTRDCCGGRPGNVRAAWRRSPPPAAKHRPAPRGSGAGEAPSHEKRRARQTL